MGEVYRARDTRLDREVAVKVLPSHLSENPEIRQRFEREARAASSLNHPHSGAGEIRSGAVGQAEPAFRRSADLRPLFLSIFRQSPRPPKD